MVYSVTNLYCLIIVHNTSEILFERKYYNAAVQQTVLTTAVPHSHKIVYLH